MTEQKTTWKSQSGYVWSLIGSAVGFANILSFSAQVYKNGGGAFLIPYCFALFILGIPMLLLEGFIGYKWKDPLVTAYGHVWGRKGKVLGWLSVLACLLIGSFYVVLTGYSVAYTYFSAVNMIPDDSQNFFLVTFLKSTEKLTDFGHFSLQIFVSALAVLGFTWWVLVKNVRDGIERICSIFMPMLAVIMVVFAIVVCFLPGGINGLRYYLTPDFSKLGNPSLWRDIFGQLFFSLSLGLGIIVGYSRHTAQKTNIVRAMMWVALGDFFVSFVAGVAIFGCLAHISFVQHVPFDSILTSDSTFEIGFILFPKILKVFGPFLSQAIGVLFFFSVFIAGITGVFSIVESIAGNVEVEFRTTRRAAVSATVLALMGLGTFFCMGNASHLIDALVPMVVGTNMLVGGLALVLAFQYSCPSLNDHKFWGIQSKVGFYGFSLKYIAPFLLAVILLGNIWQEFYLAGGARNLRWSWFAVALIISVILASRRQAKQI